MSQPTNNMPIIPPAVIPPPFDVEGRIAELQKMLDDDATEPGQKINLKAVIEMYRKGELPKGMGKLTIFQNGKVCEIPDFNNMTPWWAEVCLFEAVLSYIFILFEGNRYDAHAKSRSYFKQSCSGPEGKLQYSFLISFYSYRHRPGYIGAATCLPNSLQLQQYFWRA